MAAVYKHQRMSAAQAAQLQRIQEDEKIMAREEDIKRERKAASNASWTESLEETSQNKILKRKKKEIENEIRLANKTVSMVRKAQLRQLLAQEQLEYQRELSSMGLAIHQDRL